ncbi:MAG: hypothetical protein WD101_01645 [Gemmatimonadota bacterium]
MNPIATCTEHFMAAHPHPALRIGEILAPVADRVDRSLTAARLRSALAEHPETFRLLDPWQGPWRLRAESTPSTEADVWVVLLAGTGGDGATVGPVTTLRESVRWLARGIDPRSSLSVSRWYAIALAERESRRAIAKRSA